MKVIEIDPQTDPRWEALVTTMPDSLIYHHPAWLQVLQEVYGFKPVNLDCEDANGQLQGILPLFYKPGLLNGRSLLSLPGTPAAGPLACTARAAADLVGAAVERVLDGLVYGVVGMPTYMTYLLDLPERPEPLRFGNSQHHNSIKRAVNKAAKLGVQVRAAEKERELQAWYDFYLETMRWHGVLPRSYNFFKIIWNRLRPRGMMRLLLAEHCEAGRNRLLGGLFLLLFNRTVSYAYGGWRRQDQALRTNDALHWWAIQHARMEGFRQYDFGVVPQNNPGLAKFKSKWGTEAHYLYRYYLPCAPGFANEPRSVQ